MERLGARLSSIVVLGSANMDLVVRQPRLPHPGETMFGQSLALVPGGKGLNQAVAAALAGGDVSFVGAVGRDAFGEELRRCLDDHGVNTEGLVEVDVATGTAHIAVLDDGENSIVVVSGANDAITHLDDRSRETIRAGRYLVAQLERPIGLLSEAFAVAREAGVVTVLTPSPVSRLEPKILELVDILVPNSGEAVALAGLDNDIDAAIALSARVATVVMTRGSHGVVVARDGQVVADRPARRVRPVDTTGAGDTFTGVLVARLAGGASLDDALAAAGTAASISVTRAGASSSMPTWDEVAAEL